MTQEKLETRWSTFLEPTNSTGECAAVIFARAELQKAAEIADRYKEPLIAKEIRKLME